MGVFPDLPETVIWPNSPSVMENVKFIDEYFAEEVEAGRMSGPFTKEELEGIFGGAFQSSPLSIDEKEIDGTFELKLRMCINLSKGTDTKPSTNSYSNKADFPTSYDPAAYTGDLVANAPEGSLAMVMDISKFHRRTPICPAHKKWFVMQGRPGEFFMQHCCPFGATGSESNSGQISKAILRIWEVSGIGPSGKWSDDVVTLVAPSSGSGTADDPWVYPYDEQIVISTVSSTDIPWHPLDQKGQPFLPYFDYVGMFWDLVDRSVGVRENKRIKFHYRASVFAYKAHKDKCSEKDVMEIHGSLCHLAFVHQLGRSHLSSFSSFITEFKGLPDEYRYAPRSVKHDINWWVERLSLKDFKRPLLPLGEVIDLRISVDASTEWGIGLKWGDEWDAWRVQEGWKGPWRDIGWLECLAIELLVLHLEIRDYKNCRVRVLSDNQGIIGAYWKGRSRNVQVNYSIRRFMSILDSLHLFLEVEYVRSEDNPADPISRGELGAPDLRLSPPISLPPELIPYLSHV